MKIVPIILETSLPGFQQTLDRVAPLSNRLSVDISDGIVAPNKTIELDPVLEALVKFPEISNKKFDFDLMVKDWLPLVDALKKTHEVIKINSVVIHQQYFKKIPVTDFDIGVAVDLNDQINYSIVRKVPVIQIMTIALGFQGSEFYPKALAKITQLRQGGFEGQIIVDGGVNDQTLPLILANAGLPDVVGVGSYLTQATSAEDNFKKLEAIITDFEN